MDRPAATRVPLTIAIILLTTAPRLSRAGDGAALSTDSAGVQSNIVIGFVGGFVNHDNAHHGPVQFAQRIRRTTPRGTYVRVFENRHRKQALGTVLARLDTNRDGVLSSEEKARARIILFGHSWGASAAVLLARDLQRQGIPVLLTVQIDSVAKIWQNDSLIPDNVAEAVNFFQTQGIIHGRREITAADPAKTEILGNFRMDYKKDPVQCPGAPWLGHVLIPGHIQSECDSRLWSKIETLVRERLSSEPASVAAASAEIQQPSR